MRWLAVTPPRPLPGRPIVEVAVSRHRPRPRPRINPGLLLALALLAVLLAGSAWAVLQAHADCLAGRLPGPWC